jgi:hypothetical protein
MLNKLKKYHDVSYTGENIRYIFFLHPFLEFYTICQVIDLIQFALTKFFETNKTCQYKFTKRFTIYTSCLNRSNTYSFKFRKLVYIRSANV